ncbi:bifunctional 6-phosphogluconate dehydrogenase/6-phosphogluconate dehydrogenase [Babesia duncani]|uniref:6-phosphogluconate dehydrogenase, decarboxylating n=1 Tax=Babesia duncani TaxID=323732 RepID=A0AAD9PM34_9APIC|nr:bifunctional 6-phosphogluconate dehydrogenase/6-phosphogluconate dehydrogenase [Babesia duncani]
MSEIGIIGLGTMGSAYCRNLLYRGINVSAYSINYEEIEKVENVIKSQENAAPDGILCCFSLLDSFIASLSRPRKIIILITAGKPVDSVLDSLVPLLDSGDIVLDCGNEWFHNTIQRIDRCLSKNIKFCGIGVSGGENGARNRPCLMFGGELEIYNIIKEYMQQDSIEFYVGPGGSGHYVKMVHNGIEYAIMQVIAEVYIIMNHMLGLQNDTISNLIKSWSDDENTLLKSYLLDITADILIVKDPNKRDYLLDKIQDISGANGTGKWTVKEALDLSIPVPSISVAVEMRNASNQPRNGHLIDKGNYDFKHDLSEGDLSRTLLVCMQSIFSQGFSLLEKASNVYQWNLDLKTIAKIWSRDSIISCILLQKISENCNGDGNLINTAMFIGTINQSFKSCKRVVKACLNANVSVPCITASLQYIQTCASLHLGHNMIQAQRDYFGAHGFTRVDDKAKHNYPWTQRPSI